MITKQYFIYNIYNTKTYFKAFALQNTSESVNENKLQNVHFSR